MADNKLLPQVICKLNTVATRENIQTYILGIKKNGHPRAVWDIVKPFVSGKKKKKNKNNNIGKYELYFKPKKKKKKKSKHWKYKS